ncbi:MAG: hypothetical protein AB1728_04325 [Bacteroidota bacterium]
MKKENTPATENNGKESGFPVQLKFMLIALVLAIAALLLKAIGIL